MRNGFVLAALVCAALTTGWRGLRAQERGFVVIVNAANNTTTLTADELAHLFLKKTVRWPGGSAVVPVDQSPSSRVRAAFSTAVLEKSVGAVQAYWQTMIFSGRGVPPSELASDEAVVSFVRATPGAVGYVSPSTPLGGGVHAVRVTN